MARSGTLVDQTGEIVDEAAGGSGIDTVESRVSFNLGSSDVKDVSGPIYKRPEDGAVGGFGIRLLRETASALRYERRGT